MRTVQKLLSTILAVALLAGGCADQSAEPANMSVGVMLALTGPASALGDPERDVLLGMAADRAAFNGITLVIGDTGGDTARARILLDTLARNPDVVAVIGPSTSAESVHLGPSADAHQLTMLSLAASNRIVVDASGATRKWVFKFAQNDDLAAKRLAEAMRTNGHTTAAMFYSDDVFGNGGAQAFRAAAGALQITNDIGYASLLENGEAIARQIELTVPAVVIWGTTPGPALIVKALRTRGYAGKIYLSHGAASSAFINDAGGAAEGAYIVGSRLLLPTADLVAGRTEDEVIHSYHALWARVGTGAPSTFGGHARDALEAIIAASGSDLRHLDQATRRRELRDRLEQLRNFHGVTGTFSFSPTDHAGLTPDAFLLYRIENGTFVVASN